MNSSIKDKAIFSVTEELVRKRAEHNNGEIGSLEELSLHMLHIERIENLNNWCRQLQILQLQNNIISKIENVNRLKKLKYLNLSLNNIEKIENLEGCESLENLDLSLNFIGNLTSICTLVNNYNLSKISLMGNPCTEFEGYRYYVIHNLPQIKILDGKSVSSFDKISAHHAINSGLETNIQKQQIKYEETREKKKIELGAKLKEKLTFINSCEDADILRKIWSEKSENTPETRIILAKLSLRQEELNKQNNEKCNNNTEETKIRKFFNENGRPLNINEAKLDFKIENDGENIKLWLIINKNILKYNENLDLDFHPNYIRIYIKEFVFQLHLIEEVNPDNAKASTLLSKDTLYIILPLANPRAVISTKNSTEIVKENVKQSRREYLEIGPEKRRNDLIHFIKNNDKEEEFVDDDDVPPLEDE